MRRHGFDVTVAAGGREALEVLERHCFDVLVTDFSMPRMNGVELIRQVVSRGLAMGFVLTSGESVMTTSDRVASLPVPVAVMEKPWSDDVVADLLNKLATRPTLRIAARAS